jgi:hypothetical protein
MKRKNSEQRPRPAHKLYVIGLVAGIPGTINLFSGRVLMAHSSDAVFVSVFILSFIAVVCLISSVLFKYLDWLDSQYVNID